MAACIIAIQKRCRIVAYLSVVVLLLGQLGTWHWFLELFSHFTPWYGLGLLLGIWSVPQKWLRILFAGLLLLVVWFSIQGAEKIENNALPKESLSGTEKIISWNVNINAAEQIQDGEIELLKQADKLFLMEYGREWDYRLPRDLQQRYRCGRIEDSPFSLAFFSQEVPLHCDVQYTDDFRYYPYIRAEFAKYVLYGVHPPPPINRALASDRLNAFTVLSVAISQEKKPVIVVGDLNNTPFSPVFRQLINKSRLHSIKPNGQATWQGLLNLDHVLLSDGIVFQKSGVMQSMGGSDHRAIYVDIVK